MASQDEAAALTPVTVTTAVPYDGDVCRVLGAVSDDGLWHYGELEIEVRDWYLSEGDRGDVTERLSTRVTHPWEVVHLPTEISGGWYFSLDLARAATADGTAIDEVNRVLAHREGKHDSERDPACAKC